MKLNEISHTNKNDKNVKNVTERNINQFLQSQKFNDFDAKS